MSFKVVFPNSNEVFQRACIDSCSETLRKNYLRSVNVASVIQTMLRQMFINNFKRNYYSIENIFILSFLIHFQNIITSPKEIILLECSFDILNIRVVRDYCSFSSRRVIRKREKGQTDSHSYNSKLFYLLYKKLLTFL